MKRAWRMVMLLVILLTACGQKADRPTWQEQYDLGVKYLSEGNYEEAVLAFTAAIEIDAKRPEAYVGRGGAYVFSGETEDNLTAAQADYEAALALEETLADAWLGLADVYIRRGDYDKAQALLQEALEKTGEDQSIADKLAEIEGGSIVDSQGNMRKETVYGADGSVLHIYEYSYDSRGYKTGWTSIGFDKQGGEERGYAVVEFGEDGYPFKNIYYKGDGTLSGTYDIMTFNGLGQETERRKHHQDETFTLFRYYYDEAGRKTRYEAYRDGEELTDYWEYLYDETGKCTGTVHYGADGSIMGTSTYN